MENGGCTQPFKASPELVLTPFSLAHQVNNLYSNPSSAVVVKSNPPRTNCDASLQEGAVTTAASSAHSRTAPDPLEIQGLVMTKGHEDHTQSYQRQVHRALFEYYHPIIESRKARITPTSTSSYEHNMSHSVSYPPHQEPICRWLYETSDEIMTMTETLEKSNWEERRLEKL